MSVLLSFLHTCEVLMSRVRFFSMITPSLLAAPMTVLLQTPWPTSCNKRTQTPLQPTNSLSTHSIRYHCFTDCFYTQTATFLPPLYSKPPSFHRYDKAMNCPHFITVYLTNKALDKCLEKFSWVLVKLFIIYWTDANFVDRLLSEPSKGNAQAGTNDCMK